jgi:hypothetical protein
MATTQELFTYTDWFKGYQEPADLSNMVVDSCQMNHKYYLKASSKFYFIVRPDKYYPDEDMQRVCLYEEGAINLLLEPGPFDLWHANELRDDRGLQTLYEDMELKASELTPKTITKKRIF